MKKILLLFAFLFPLLSFAQRTVLKFEVTVEDNFGNPLPNTNVYYFYPIPPSPGVPDLADKKHFKSNTQGIVRFTAYSYTEIIFGSKKSGRQTVTFTPTENTDSTAIIPIKIICTKKE